MTDQPKDKRFVRKHTCEDCPFKRGCPPKVGNDDPLVYVGQAAGPFLLACHSDPEYWDKKDGEGLFELMQCAGAAMFRSSIHVAGMMPDSLHKLENNGEAFESASELVAHHLGIDRFAARKLIAESGGLAGLLKRELSRAEVRTKEVE